jgi:HD-GYP domain-containing protein (c-di-GMP phosphodiesterase class II)
LTSTGVGRSGRFSEVERLARGPSKPRVAVQLALLIREGAKRAIERAPRRSAIAGSTRPYTSRVTTSATGSGVRLADLVAAFSLATDLGLGQPMDHVLRAWRIASQLGDHVGIEADRRADLYYVVTLAWVGCVADTPEVAALFGDDIAFRADSYEVDFAGLPLLGFMLRHVGAGSPPLQRVRLAAGLMATGGKAVQRGLISHCLTTARLAERFELGEQVCRPLQQVFARWDGKGVPSDLSGDEIDLPMRLFHLADTVEVHHRTAGAAAALAVARAKRGSHFDPAVVDAFCGVAHDILGDAAAEHDWDALIDEEPSLQQRLDGAQLDDALEAIADFTDLRSVHRAGHSRATAELAARAATEMGLPEAEVTNVRRAGLVHDLGLHGVPASILDKPTPLRAAEQERLRMHPYYTERMLARSEPLSRLGEIASLVRERCDGSGYPRGLTAATIPATARVLAAACAYCAMVEPRAHRPPMTAKHAAGGLRDDVRAGRLDATAVDAVLAAAGQRQGKRRVGPSGLTPRELEVLLLIARGASTRQVARELAITPKTAETHIERIYTKTGATTRSTATLFALQNGLLGTLEPLDL